MGGYLCWVVHLYSLWGPYGVSSFLHLSVGYFCQLFNKGPFFMRFMRLWLIFRPKRLIYGVPLWGTGVGVLGSFRHDTPFEGVRMGFFGFPFAFFLFFRLYFISPPTISL